jgi:hypothetical protein
MGITAPRPGISGGAQPEERNLRGLICRASGPCAPPAHLELQRQPLFELGGIAQQARAVKEAILARGALDEPVAPFLAESPQATHLPPGPVRLLLGAAFRACCGSRIGGLDHEGTPPDPDRHRLDPGPVPRPYGFLGDRGGSPQPSRWPWSKYALCPPRGCGATCSAPLRRGFGLGHGAVVEQRGQHPPYYRIHYVHPHAR